MAGDAGPQLVATGPSVDGPAGGSPGAGQHAWDRFVPWWTAGFALTVAATAGFAIAEVHDPAASKPCWRFMPA